MAVPVPNNHDVFTYAHYVTWPDEERWELIDGIPFDMSPAPSRQHQEISMAFSSVIHNFIKKGSECKVYAAPFDVRFQDKGQLEEDIINVVQPDISVICDKEKLDDKGCKGAPDFIIEIVSPSTAKKDIKYKLALYEKYAVKEYWIVHPVERIVQVFQLNEQKKYDHPEVYGYDDTIPVTINKNTLELALNEIFPETEQQKKEREKLQEKQEKQGEKE